LTEVMDSGVQALFISRSRPPTAHKESWLREEFNTITARVLSESAIASFLVRGSEKCIRAYDLSVFDEKRWRRRIRW
jgi:hypothetical protein